MREADFDAAAAGQGVGGQHGGQFQLALDAGEAGLLHRHRDGRGDLLADLEAVFGAAGTVGSFELPVQGRGASGASAFQATGSAFGFQLDLAALRALLPALAVTWTVIASGAVPQGEAGGEAVLSPHQGRQAGDHLQLLLGAEVPLPVPKRPVPASATATTLNSLRESLTGTFTVALPLASSATGGSTEAGCRTIRGPGRGRRRRPGNGLLAEVALADDLGLGGGGFHLVAAAGQHGFQEFPALVGAQLQQRLVHGGQGHLGAGGDGLAVGLATLMRTLAVSRGGGRPFPAPHRPSGGNRRRPRRWRRDRP